MKKNLAVVGVQWGDEGKGKIVDILSEEYDCVARYQGGHNAGHTVIFQGKRYVLHLVPSGIFQPSAQCVIGGGVVVDPLALLEEIHMIEQAGMPVKGRLFVSNRCQVIFPHHQSLDDARESALGDRKIGTTVRGIGPAYEGKTSRRGLRMCDLMNSAALEDKIRERVTDHNQQLAMLRYPHLVNAELVCESYAKYAERLSSFVKDTSAYLNELMRSGKSVLFEGAQGTMLDVDLGTFPFVTSSNAAAGGIAAGLGISPKFVHHITGITKAYTTRVGSGPFPTEAFGEQGELIRKRGNEYGATTGRPRRCGWFDGPVARYASMVNFFDDVIVTKLDILDEFAEIPFCVGYKYKGCLLKEFPAEAAVLGKVEAQYQTLRGWTTPTTGIRNWADLPVRAQDYIKFMRDYLEVPITGISNGPAREDFILV